MSASLKDFARDVPVPRGQIGILITEVTRMRPGIVCVAGFRLDTGSRVRPLQADGNNWHRHTVPDPFEVGAVAVGTVSGVQPAGARPHANEDLRLANVPTRAAQAEPSTLFEICLGASATSVDGAAGIETISGKYVVDGTDCHSLFSVRIRADLVEPYKAEDSKMRVKVECGAIHHDFSITALDLQSDDAIATLSKTLKRLKKSEIVLQLGLARPWAKYAPARCYIQVNGFILPPAS